MSPGNDNQVDWKAAATPDERLGPGLSGQKKRTPLQTHTRSSVMDTLLGENNLSAYDASGSDPYNATGKSFQR